MARVIVDPGQFTKVNDMANRRLKNAVKAVGVAQLELISEAFRTQGQPGEPWPPMWADSFQGRTRRGAEEKIEQAKKSLGRAKKSREKTLSLLPGISVSLRAGAKRDANQKVKRAEERLRKAEENAGPATSHRKGGKRLSGSTSGEKSFFIQSSGISDGKGVSVMATSAFHHKWHQQGFNTKGPNFIPLTKKAARLHAKGANPKDEGLEWGVDYIIAKDGVSVPPSPMIDYGNTVNKQVLADSIRAGFFGAI